jgi:hypothetical protein
MKLRLKNQFGITKDVKIGFSWTTFFFGIFPAIFRGDGLGVLSLFLLGIASILLATEVHPIFYLLNLVGPFCYNQNYIQRLLDNGYKPLEEGEGLYLLRTKGFILPLDEHK